MSQTEKDANEQMLQNIYKSSKMGIDAIATLMPKVRDEAFKAAMATQLNGYQKFAADATTRLTSMNKIPEDAGIMQKMPAQLGMAMGCAADKSDSKIAEMMLNGSVMGITEIKKQLNKTNCLPEETSRLANEVVSFEEGNIVNLKTYL